MAEVVRMGQIPSSGPPTAGGYAVAGFTTSKGAGEEDLWVIKLDEQGNLK